MAGRFVFEGAVALFVHCKPRGISGSSIEMSYLHVATAAVINWNSLQLSSLSNLLVVWPDWETSNYTRAEFLGAKERGDLWICVIIMTWGQGKARTPLVKVARFQTTSQYNYLISHDQFFVCKVKQNLLSMSLLFCNNRWGKFQFSQLLSVKKMSCCNIFVAF